MQHNSFFKIILFSSGVKIKVIFIVFPFIFATFLNFSPFFILLIIKLRFFCFAFSSSPTFKLFREDSYFFLKSEDLNKTLLLAIIDIFFFLTSGIFINFDCEFKLFLSFVIKDF